MVIIIIIIQRIFQVNVGRGDIADGNEFVPTVFVQLGFYISQDRFLGRF
jgi:hypothetical protein